MLMESLEWKGKEFPEIFVSCKNGQSFQYVHNSILVVSKTILSRGLVLFFFGALLPQEETKVPVFML